MARTCNRFQSGPDGIRASHRYSNETTRRRGEAAEGGLGLLEHKTNLQVAIATPSARLNPANTPSPDPSPIAASGRKRRRANTRLRLQPIRTIRNWTRSTSLARRLTQRQSSGTSKRFRSEAVIAAAVGSPRAAPRCSSWVTSRSAHRDKRRGSTSARRLTQRWPTVKSGDRFSRSRTYRNGSGSVHRPISDVGWHEITPLMRCPSGFLGMARKRVKLQVTVPSELVAWMDTQVKRRRFHHLAVPLRSPSWT